MEIILNSEFPQFKPLSAEAFSKFLSERGIKLNVELLEYYDEKGIIRPALRLHRPKLSETSCPKYATIFDDCFSMKEYYKQGLIELPKDWDFQPWTNYRDGYEKILFSIIILISLYR